MQDRRRAVDDDFLLRTPRWRVSSLKSTLSLQVKGETREREFSQKRRYRFNFVFIFSILVCIQKILRRWPRSSAVRIVQLTDALSGFSIVFRFQRIPFIRLSIIVWIGRFNPLIGKRSALRIDSWGSCRKSTVKCWPREQTKNADAKFIGLRFERETVGGWKAWRERNLKNRLKAKFTKQYQMDIIHQTISAV